MLTNDIIITNMKRKELIERYNIKESFMNFMCTRATILKNHKAGMGYANEYDEKDVSLILIGWELHKMGISFRFIDRLLFIWKERFLKDLKTFLKKECEYICITSEKCSPKGTSKQLLDLAWESFMSKNDVMRLIEEGAGTNGMILINAKQMVVKQMVAK